MTRYFQIFVICIFALSACELKETQFSSNSAEQLPASRSNFCTDKQRFLNPDSEPKPSETDLDRYFRMAFNAETEGKFDEAIAYYQRAAEMAKCDCDRKHALAGKQAATEAKDLASRQGMASKPTQFFWIRLQELTESLPCVRLKT